MKPRISLPGGCSAREFLRDYWQKKPLLLRGVFDDLTALLSADELAGLACEPDVESRLIAGGTGSSWQLRHGPFEEREFGNLPEREWTLLVQAVDQWIPEIADWLENFNFLPRWQLDDVMVSYAADGGSVGPHYDNYDVFLVQAEGRRLWRLGQTCSEHSSLEPDLPLRILGEFECHQEYLLEPGDMLYLPPRVAHWGIADGECMTWSVGYRSPSAAEWIDEYVRQALDAGSASANPLPLPVDELLDPFCLPERIREPVTDFTPLKAADGTLLARSLGVLSTRPRYPDLIDEVAESNRASSLTRTGSGAPPVRLGHNPHSRFGYRQRGDGAELFVDGQHYICNLETALLICHNRLFLLADAGSDTDLLLRLVGAGALIVDP